MFQQVHYTNFSLKRKSSDDGNDTWRAVPTIFNRDKYVTILKNTGWSYNRYLKENRLYPTDSLPGTVL